MEGSALVSIAEAEPISFPQGPLVAVERNNFYNNVSMKVTVGGAFYL